MGASTSREGKVTEPTSKGRERNEGASCKGESPQGKGSKRPRSEKSAHPPGKAPFFNNASAACSGQQKIPYHHRARDHFRQRQKHSHGVEDPVH